MVNTKFNSVRPTTPVNTLIEKPTTRVYGPGRDKERVRGRGGGRVSPTIDGAPIENVPVNENPLAT